MKTPTKSTKKPVNKTVKPMTKATAQTVSKPTPKPLASAMTAPATPKSPCRCSKISPVKAGFVMGILGVFYAFLIHLYPIFLNRHWEFVPPKANSLKFVMSDVYVGYNMGETWLGLVYMTGWAFLDGFIFAFLFAWLYNLLSTKK